ncbi:hypothetical protein BUALT_Bualt03G0221300 [Buddleja alternifolia]|uniref:Protein kinase domain-containing protein n=1 Tax=Buddleja alternifolia TaxID=168488 RepID=A0AAV6Y6R0_9LAMI|nr:hypothetical protein BUALT_Bualt03G0221300 [Buddleja alternifolia]
MTAGDYVQLSYKELECYTDSFSERSYLGHFQFGKLYHGKINCLGWTQHVLVKIWEVPEIYNYFDGDNELRLIDELILLSHEKLTTHPGMVKLYGYCLEGDHLGVVYDFKPFDSVYNLIPKVRNLDAAHLVLDEDYNPKICDFGLITGGVFPNRTIFKHHHVIGCYGYIDSCAFYAGDFSDKIDVFGFGAILLSLIMKRVYTEEERLRSAPFVFKLALNEYEEYEYGSESETEVNRPKFSVVHQSLAAEPGYCPDDGHKLSMMGVECVIGLGSERPNMKQILNSMLKLNVVKEHADYLGVNDAIRSCENSP